MSSEDQTVPVSKKVLWAGWIVSVLPVLMLLMSATMKLMRAPAVMEGLPKMGYPAGLALPLGIVELGSTILYLIPQTSVLGAILLTGYLGGATATHVRIGDPSFYIPVILGVLVWGGLFLRDPRIRALIPLKK
jgi:hypothetical protein